MKFRDGVLLLLALTAISASGAAPNVAFGPDGLTVLDVTPGTKVAWMSLTRSTVANHTSIRVDRGVEAAMPSNGAAIARSGAEQAHAIWVIAAIDDDVAGTAISPGYSASPSPVPVIAAADASTISVVSPEVELLYVRPQGGAWFLSATNGGIGDQDHVQDTVIKISLQSLEPAEGSPNPPATTAAGDLILVIDPRSNRTAVVKVGQ
jgi:hypothetical protein